VEERLNVLDEELDQLNLEMKAVQDNLDNLEEKNAFIEAKIHEINLQLMHYSPEDVEQINLDDIQSIEGARATLSTFFKILMDVNLYKRFLEN
jgi:chromosome segregation ATPase